MAEQFTEGPPQPPDPGSNLPGKIGHHGEFIPDVTIPQGTQLQGVEHGHEEADVDFRSLIGWFGGLVGLVAVCILVLYGAFALLVGAANRANALPSPIMAVQNPPPEPRVLPNPVDSRANPDKPMMGPQFMGRRENAAQIDELERAGLWDDRTGEPRLPPDAMAVVSRENPPAGSAGAIDGSKKPMPSASSGGTSVEDQLE